jgi:hypothetical protein
MLQPALSLFHDDTIAIHVLQLYFALIHACYPALSFVNQFQSVPLIPFGSSQEPTEAPDSSSRRLSRSTLA